MTVLGGGIHFTECCVVTAVIDNDSQDIDNRVLLEIIDKFCCLGNILDAYRGCQCQSQQRLSYFTVFLLLCIVCFLS